jgi:hypothetical protein
MTSRACAVAIPIRQQTKAKIDNFFLIAWTQTRTA